MTNELLLVGTLVAYFGFMLLAYKLFGRAGLYGFTIFATVVGNIEVLLLVNAFGMDQTLGNVIFATTYSAAKILSEMEGEKGPDYAKKATWLSVGTTGVFMLITQTWAWYAPADGGLLQPGGVCHLYAGADCGLQVHLDAAKASGERTMGPGRCIHSVYPAG